MIPEAIATNGSSYDIRLRNGTEIFSGALGGSLTPLPMV
jgi:hypothetical protein